jgi:large-conductance mechanosensitive channel
MSDAKRSPFVQLSLSLVASMVVAVLELLLVRCLAPASWLHANNEVAGNYLQTVGTIYAVLLAFVVFVVWRQHNDTRNTVESEANELSDFSRAIQALPGTQLVRDFVQKYGKVVVDDEWLDMAQPVEPGVR